MVMYTADCVTVGACITHVPTMHYHKHAAGDELLAIASRLWQLLPQRITAWGKECLDQICKENHLMKQVEG